MHPAVRFMFAVLPVLGLAALVIILAGWREVVISFGADFALGFMAGAALYMVWVRIELGRWV